MYVLTQEIESLRENSLVFGTKQIVPLKFNFNLSLWLFLNNKDLKRNFIKLGPENALEIKERGFKGLKRGPL